MIWLDRDRTVFVWSSGHRNIEGAVLPDGGVVRSKLEDGLVVGEERLLPDVGRVRDVEVLPDGDLLVLLDGPDAEILRVTPVGGAEQ